LYAFDNTEIYQDENQEIELDSLSNQDRALPRLIDETYAGSESDYVDYQYADSLSLENLILPSVKASVGSYGVAKVLDYISRKYFSVPARLLNNIGGMTFGRDMTESFLGGLGTVTREAVNTGLEYDTYIGAEELGFDIGFTVTDPAPEVQYIANMPWGIVSSFIFAFTYYKAVNGIHPVKRSEGIAPRMNYYKKGGEDVFTIRGTAGLEDLTNDLLVGIGGQSYSPALIKKIDVYEKFIRDRYRGGKLLIAGHSLGSLETSVLSDRLADLSPTTVGYAHPGFAPSDKMTRAYSFEGDPLYHPSGKPNHFVIKKPYKGGDRFTEFHSTKNYH